MVKRQFSGKVALCWPSGSPMALIGMKFSPLAEDWSQGYSSGGLTLDSNMACF